MRLDPATGAITEAATTTPASRSTGDCGPIWESDLFTGLPQSISVAGGRAFVAVHRPAPTVPDIVIAYAPATASPEAGRR